MNIQASIAQVVPKKITTELGEEKYCNSCAEYWPLGADFWYLKLNKNTGLRKYVSACKACWNKCKHNKGGIS